MIRRVDGWRRGVISDEDYYAAIQAGGEPTDRVEIAAKAVLKDRPPKTRTIKRSAMDIVAMGGEGSDQS